MRQPVQTILAILIAAFLFSVRTHGQDAPAFRFSKIEVDDGLSENAVNCIIQDSRGFMWFGTRDGLNRYDGTGFRVYMNDPGKHLSLGNNFVGCLLEGASDILYVGTGAGLYIMNRADETFTKLNTKTVDGTEVTSAINSMLLDEKEWLWLATATQGVFVLDTNKNTLRKIDIAGIDLNENAVWHIMRDRSGVVWAGTRLGMLRFDSRRERLEAVPGLSGGVAPENEVMCITEDAGGDLWLGTWNSGVKRYDRKSGRCISYGDDDITIVRTIFPYSDREMLIGSAVGLYRLNTVSGAVSRVDTPRSRQSLSDRSIYAIVKDREGGIWIGTYFGGVNYLNASSMYVETYAPDNLDGTLSGRAVGPFCEDPSGNLWIGTEDGGLNYFDVRTREITQPAPTSSHNIQALLIDGRKLWIGTLSRGLDLYDLDTKRLVNLRHVPGDHHTIDNDCIFSLCKTAAGDIYVGTSVGLNRYDRRNGNFIRIPEGSGFVSDMTEDDRGNLWIATMDAGAKRLNMQTGEWVRYDDVKHRSNPIVGRNLCGVYFDAAGNLIYTSRGGGIFFYEYADDNFHNISMTDGLPGNVVYEALDDADGNLWLSSNTGVICLDRESPGRSRMYDKSDGMQSNQFNFRSAFKARDGKFYFGGINGFSCFYPHELTRMHNGVVPPVAVTQIELLGDVSAEKKNEATQSLHRGGRIELPYRHSSFRISFVSLSYVSQQKNRYAYMLDGFDTEWIDAGNDKSVSYLGLAPGKYVFRVKGSNNDGVWNDEGAHIEIYIRPPFWRSVFAKIMYVLLSALLGYLVIRYYVRRSQRRQAAELKAITAEEEKRSFQSKIDFFTTIAHEIRTPLSLISAPLEEIIASGDGEPQTRRNLQIIDRNRNRLLTLVNQLLDFRKMESRKHILTLCEIHLPELLSELYERFRKTARSRNIDMTLELPEEKDLRVVSDPDAVLKITGNLLTNALKFTSDRIALSLSRHADGSYTIRVADNGRGIPNRIKKLVFDPFYQVREEDGRRGAGIGLSLVRNLAEILNGRVEVTDVDGGGSCFAFTFADLAAVPAVGTDGELVPEDTPGLVETGNKPRVLVVDDNRDMTLFISRSLENGYNVDTAADVAQAMTLLEENAYELIVSDIIMPGVDGISFARSLKSDVNYSHIPVILLSAKTDNPSKAEGLHSGADVFIEKPFSMEHLRAQIASLLNNRRSLVEAFNRSPFTPYSTLAVSKSDDHFLKQLNDEIEKNISDENFTVESLIGIFSMSRSNLQRKVKSISGVTPGEYLRNYRLRRACRFLLETDMRINEVAFEVGFSSASYFTKVFYKTYEMTPREFIARNVSEKNR